MADGDARIALNALELAASAAEPREGGGRVIDRALIEEALQRPALLYDKSGDMHYHMISALIKSVRGRQLTQPSTGWLRMFDRGRTRYSWRGGSGHSGCRRHRAGSSQALSLAVAAQQAAHFVGIRKDFWLAEATLYLASAPKSNSAMAAYGRAIADVEATRNEPVPLHLRNASTALSRQQGYGKGYKYSHDFDDHYVQQQYLPDDLAERQYYEPTTMGAEAEIRKRLSKLRKSLE